MKGVELKALQVGTPKVSGSIRQVWKILEKPPGPAGDQPPQAEGLPWLPLLRSCLELGIFKFFIKFSSTEMMILCGLKLLYKKRKYWNIQGWPSAVQPQMCLKWPDPVQQGQRFPNLIWLSPNLWQPLLWYENISDIQLFIMHCLSWPGQNWVDSHGKQSSNAHRTWQVWEWGVGLHLPLPAPGVHLPCFIKPLKPVKPGFGIPALLGPSLQIWVLESLGRIIIYPFIFLIQWQLSLFSLNNMILWSAWEYYFWDCRLIIENFKKELLS